MFRTAVRFGRSTGVFYDLIPDYSGQGQVWHQGPFNFANGLALSPREEALYVVCSFDASIERIEVAPNGRAGNRTLFARLPRTVPDGLAFDAAGNLYVSCYAPNHLYRVMPDGKVELLMDDWELIHCLTPQTLRSAVLDLINSLLPTWDGGILHE